MMSILGLDKYVFNLPILLFILFSNTITRLCCVCVLKYIIVKVTTRKNMLQVYNKFVYVEN